MGVPMSSRYVLNDLKGLTPDESGQSECDLSPRSCPVSLDDLFIAFLEVEKIDFRLRGGKFRSLVPFVMYGFPSTAFFGLTGEL